MRKGSAIENMGFYIIAIIVSIVGVTLMIYFAGSMVNKIINIVKGFIIK